MQNWDLKGVTRVIFNEDIDAFSGESPQAQTEHNIFKLLWLSLVPFEKLLVLYHYTKSINKSI